MNIKDISVVLGILVTLSGAFIGYGQLMAKADVTKENVVSLHEETKEIDKRLVNEEKINVEQSVILRQTVDVLEKLSDKLEKKGR